MPDPAGDELRLWRLLERSLDLPERERAELVERLREEEPAVAAALARLIARSESGGGFLAESIRELTTRPPARVGPYRLTDRLGQGGNGVVFRAERASGQPSYPVAVKILWSRLDAAAADRFAEEVEHLGALDHPGICRMLDAGRTETGAPWFAMELVDGAPIDRYCAGRALALRARLELFLKVLAAVEYAHSRQVLHCDLKPSNVLVDRHGRPRLLDFGIAGKLEAGTTTAGAVAFTPGYASPEQMRGERIGTASEVFSLGATLHHLICDRPPFANQDPLATALGRAARTGPVAMAEQLARRAHGPIRARAVRGRLQAILDKAMADHPEARYLSTSRFAEDLESFLRDRPVRATRAGVLERLGLAARRHRIALSAGLLLALSAGVVVVASIQVATEHRRAEAVYRLLLESLADLDPSTRPAGELSARELVLRASRRVDSRALGRDTRAEYLLSIGSLFGSVGAYEPAAEALEEARRLRPRDPRTLESLAIARVRVAEYDDAERLAREALELREAAGGGPESSRAVATLAWTVLRNSRNDERRLAEAERLAARAVELTRSAGGSELELARAERLRASVLQQVGRTDEALELAASALDRLERAAAPAYELADAASDLALSEQKAGRIAPAIERLRRVVEQLEGLLGSMHPEVADALTNLGIALAEGRSFEEATAVLDRALELYSELLGADHPMTLNCASSDAWAYQEIGDLARAERLHRRVAEGLESALGAEHPFLPLAWAYLAENLALQGRPAEARAALERRSLPPSTAESTWMSLEVASIRAFVEGRASRAPEIEEELERTRLALVERFGERSRAAQAAEARLERHRARGSS